VIATILLPLLVTGCAEDRGGFLPFERQWWRLHLDQGRDRSCFLLGDDFETYTAPADGDGFLTIIGRWQRDDPVALDRVHYTVVGYAEFNTFGFTAAYDAPDWSFVLDEQPGTTFEPRRCLPTPDDPT